MKASENASKELKRRPGISPITKHHDTKLSVLLTTYDKELPEKLTVKVHQNLGRQQNNNKRLLKGPYLTKYI